MQDEIIFTEDLVVGQNQEVTEEEVVTTQEVVLSEDGQMEEVVITPDGQLVLTQNGEMIVAPEGHIVIHDGEIYVNSTEGGFPHLQPIQLIHAVDELDASSPSKLDSSISPLKQCIITDGKILDTSGLDIDSDSALNSTETGVLSLNSSDDGGEQIGVDNNVYASIDVLDFKHETHNDAGSCELDSSSAYSENSHSSGSPGAVSVVVKQEMNEDVDGHTVLLQKVLDIVQGK